MFYFGFDLGDGESCIHYSEDLSAGNMQSVPVSGKESFISAVGTLNGNLVVGRHVQQNSETVENQHVCFKRHFLENRPETDAVIVDFVRGVMNELRKNPDVGTLVDSPEQACFVVGCPAGWKPEERERYRGLMVRGGMKNVRIVSESRAAFENAMRSRENGIDADLSKQTVLVIDIGSSTLDFAYIRDGNEYNVETMGNVLLGGGLMDEMIVRRSLELQEETSPVQVREIREQLESSDAVRSRLMLEVREIKEEYFNQEDFFFDEGRKLEKNARLFIGGRPLKVNLQISPDIVENWLISRPHPLLNNQSFESRLRDSLVQVHGKIRKQKEPDLVILTGGASRMRFFRELCEKEFRQSRLVISKTPETDISRGLVFVGGIDENLTACVRAIREYARGNAVEDRIDAAIPELVEAIGGPMTDSIMTECVRESFKKWRNAELDTLSDFEDETADSVQRYMSSPRMQAAIREQVEAWSRNIMGQVELDLAEVCQRYQVNMSLIRGMLRLTPGKGEGPDMPGIEFDFINLINKIVAVVMMVVAGMLCGGAGAAWIAAGPVGIIVGAVIALALALGLRGPAEKALKNMRIAPVLRKVISVNSVVSEGNTEKVRKSLCQGMLEDRDMRAGLIAQVSECIDQAIDSQASQVEKAMA